MTNYRKCNFTCNIFHSPSLNFAAVGWQLLAVGVTEADIYFFVLLKSLKKIFSRVRFHVLRALNGDRTVLWDMIAHSLGLCTSGLLCSLCW